MSTSEEPASRGIEDRFRDFNADVREERLVRYVVHQVQSGRHVSDILNDEYVAAHFDLEARSHILEEPEVIKAIEAQTRRQFAGYEDSVPSSKPSGGDQDPAGQANDG